MNDNTESRQDEEEVFAESYDDPESKENSGGDPFRINKKFGDTTAKRESSDRNRYLGHPGCPNKWNAYHECNSWCQRHWGDGKKEPEPEYLKKYKVGLFEGYVPYSDKSLRDVLCILLGPEHDEQIRPTTRGMARALRPRLRKTLLLVRQDG